MLKVAKYPAYLSPSSLRAFEQQPNKFFLQRMSEDPMPYEPQGEAAAAGSAFDHEAKLDFVTRKGLERDHKATLLKDATYHTGDKELARLNTLPYEQVSYELAVDQQWRDLMRPVGKELFRIYKANGGPNIGFVSVDVHRNFQLLGHSEGVVPLFMKLDTTVEDSITHKVCPLDWKVTGYGSDSGASPKPGYMALYDKGVNKGAHKNYRYDICIEEIDKWWASQLTTYCWGLGLPHTEEHIAYIDNMVIRPTSVRLARYRARVTIGYQSELRERYVRAWRAIKDGSFVRSLSKDRKLVSMMALNENWYD
jgi:hypothetical protein